MILDANNRGELLRITACTGVMVAIVGVCEMTVGSSSAAGRSNATVRLVAAELLSTALKPSPRRLQLGSIVKKLVHLCAVREKVAEAFLGISVDQGPSDIVIARNEKNALAGKF